MQWLQAGDTAGDSLWIEPAASKVTAVAPPTHTPKTAHGSSFGPRRTAPDHPIRRASESSTDRRFTAVASRVRPTRCEQRSDAASGCSGGSRLLRNRRASQYSVMQRRVFGYATQRGNSPCLPANEHSASSQFDACCGVGQTADTGLAA